MEPTILFEEVQAFTKKATTGFFKIAIGVLLLSSMLSFSISLPNGNQLGAGLLTGALIAAIVSLAMNKVRMVTQIRTDGIYVRYPPLQSAFSFFNWQQLDRIYIRQYHPLSEFGGWGIRMAPMGRAYIVSGNVGIQLVFKNGAKILIGTNQPEVVATVLQRLEKLDYLPFQ